MLPFLLLCLILAVMKKAVEKAPDNPWVRQSHDISRAAYNLPALGRRIVFVAMAKVQAEQDDTLTARFTLTELSDLLGRAEYGGKDQKEIVDVLDQIVRTTIRTKEADGGIWVRPWFHEAGYFPDDGEVVIAFHPKLSDAVLEFRDQFTVHYLGEYGRLTGRYSQRIYEIVMSYKGFAGKDGNPPGQWWCEFPVQELREMLGVKDNEYTRMEGFRRSCVDNPVHEINEKIPDIRIDVERIKRGRRLRGFKFRATIRRRNEPRVANPEPATETEAEEQKKIDANPDLYDQLYQEALDAEATNPLFGGLCDETIAMSARTTALQMLVNHPDYVPPKNARGRPRKTRKK